VDPYEYVAAPTGLSSAALQSGSSVAGESLPLPQSCTASNFSVTVFGASGTSQMTVALTTTSAASAQLGNIDAIQLSCTATANNGSPVTCTSSATAALTAPTYVNIFISASDPAAFASNTIQTSFICQ
jgi:hypothetical protein